MKLRLSSLRQNEAELDDLKLNILNEEESMKRQLDQLEFSKAKLTEALDSMGQEEVAA